MPVGVPRGEDPSTIATPSSRLLRSKHNHHTGPDLAVPLLGASHRGTFNYEAERSAARHRMPPARRDREGRRGSTQGAKPRSSAPMHIARIRLWNAKPTWSIIDRMPLSLLTKALKSLRGSTGISLPRGAETFLRVTDRVGSVVLKGPHEPQRIWVRQKGLNAYYDNSDDRNTVPFWCFASRSAPGTKIDRMVRCKVTKDVNAKMLESLIDTDITMSGTDLSPWLWAQVQAQMAGQRGLLSTEKRGNIFHVRSIGRHRAPGYLGAGGTFSLLVYVWWDPENREWVVRCGEPDGLSEFTVGASFFFRTSEKAPS